MASLVKTVEMRVLADAGDAQAKLDELDAKANEMGAEGVHMRFRLDDEDAQAQLDDLKARADELGLKDVSIKVKVDGAGRAIADLSAVKEKTDELKDDTEAKSLLSKLFGGGADGGSGLLGGLLGGGGGGGGLAGLATASPMWTGIVAALPVVVPEVVALAAGFAAAGTGAGAFAALAYPAVKQVESAYSSLTTAQQAYQTAQQKYDLDPSTSNQSALKSAADNLKVAEDALDKLPQSEQSAVAQIRIITGEFANMSRAFRPEAFEVFNAGLLVVAKLLPDITPFATTFANVLTQLLGQASKFESSTGFADWLKQFHSLEGPALNSIGDGIGKVAIAFGKLLTSFSSTDVAHGINIAFDVLAGAINGVRLAVEGLSRVWDALSRNPTIKSIAGDIATAWDSISKTGKKEPDFSGLEKGLQAAVKTGVAWLDANLLPDVENILTKLASWLDSHAPSLLIPAGKAIMEGLLQGLESKLPDILGFMGKIALAIAEHKGPLDYDRQLLVPHGQAIMDGLMAGIGSRMPALTSQLAGVSADIHGLTLGGYTGGSARPFPVAAAGDHVEIHFNGVVGDPQAVGRQIHQVMREYKRHGGNAPLGIG